MKAIFIAAGKGSRLGSLTNNLPKPLVDVNGKSIIERQINLLSKKNINDIVIVTGYKKEKFTFKNIEYVFNPNFLTDEQAGSLMRAREKFSGDVLIMFGDILFDEQILEQVLNVNDHIAIAIDKNWKKSYLERNDNPIDKADKVLLKNNKIVQVSAKQIDADLNVETGELLGIMKLSSEGSKILIEHYEKLENNHTGKFHDAESFQKAKFVDILQELISTGISINPIIITGNWCEIDTPDDLARAKKIFV
ncbi:MAG: phosphocholine cytidylyltransferase family protein [Thaumarchaeota archaeon]|jgi:choline kinase|nr:phosphocholine cytidylyltransferase family protein [Nitrososphaerota archaeon]MBT5238192.1 phosphocholine cytidylyltransferase family protein [Nitrososphaerota archaeon]MBT6171711.1 phosphocholine cytidylyltransferase family protein [Nitrososphaerota archaeon]MBT6370324.1 phosphocholine cytidylyltransferase family protein [Nitrososphaerota archaeon]